MRIIHQNKFLNIYYLWFIRYLGNLNAHPVETHYRCTEMKGCNSNLDVPPISNLNSPEVSWSASKIHGKEPIPVITSEHCTIDTIGGANDNNIELLKEEL